MVIRTVIVAATVSACSAFDDQRAGAWSDSQEQPDGVTSTDYGAALTSVDREQPGATIVVAGLNPRSFTTMSYDDRGELRQSGAEFPEVTLLGTPAIAGATDPIDGGDGVFAVGGLEAGDPMRLYDARTGPQGPVLRATIQPDVCGADIDFIGGALVFGLTGAGSAIEPDLVALAGDGSELLLFPDILLLDEPECHRCTLPSSATDLAIDEIGDLDGEEIFVLTDEVLVLGAAAVAAGGACSAPLVRLVPPEGEPPFGTRIETGDVDANESPEVFVPSELGNRIYVARDVGSSDPDAPLLVVPSPAGSVAFGTAITTGDFRDDGCEELAVGDPGASPETVTGAGQVTVYRFDDIDGFVPIATLYDSTPEPDQAFGRTLTVTEFVAGGAAPDLLVVGAAREVFTYFRFVADADDPRQ